MNTIKQHLIVPVFQKTCFQIFHSDAAAHHADIAVTFSKDGMHAIHIILMSPCHDHKIRLISVINGFQCLRKRFTDNFICPCLSGLVAESRAIINNCHMKAHHSRHTQQSNRNMSCTADNHLLSAADFFCKYFTKIKLKH